MDSFGVPKKVNRYLINALYSLTCGLPNFFVPFDSVMDEVRYQMRNLTPIANEEQVFKMALQNLCNVGVVKSRGNDCALSSFGRINASRQEVLRTFPPKSKMKHEDRKSTNENKIKGSKGSHKISGNRTLINTKREMNKKEIAAKQGSTLTSIEDMCPICSINKSFLLNVPRKCCNKPPQQKIKKINFKPQEALEEECETTYPQSSSALDCDVCKNSEFSGFNKMQGEQIIFEYNNSRKSDRGENTRKMSNCSITSHVSYSNVGAKKIATSLQKSCFETRNTPKRMTQNKKKKFKSHIQSSNTSQMNRDDFIKRFYTCDITPFYLN